MHLATGAVVHQAAGAAKAIQEELGPTAKSMVRGVVDAWDDIRGAGVQFSPRLKEALLCAERHMMSSLCLRSELHTARS